MFDARFRRWIAPALARPADAVAGLGITANQVTAAGFVMALAGAGAIAGGRPLVGMALWLASRLLDALDGAVARRRGAPGEFGGFLDITLDMLAYGMMAAAFGMRHPEHLAGWMLVLVGYVGCITTTAVLSSLLERRRWAVPGDDRSLQFTPGFAEAGETTAVYLLLAILPAWAGWVVWAWVVVLFATIVQRIVLAARLLREPPA